jgi:hypothetical protein
MGGEYETMFIGFFLKIGRENNLNILIFFGYFFEPCIKIW